MTFVSTETEQWQLNDVSGHQNLGVAEMYVRELSSICTSSFSHRFAAYNRSFALSMHGRHRLKRWRTMNIHFKACVRASGHDCMRACVWLCECIIQGSHRFIQLYDTAIWTNSVVIPSTDECHARYAHSATKIKTSKEKKMSYSFCATISTKV